MEESKKIVSIIVPCYNQAEYLPETLDSVLAQTYPYWECIIVNDGSPDNTEEVARKYCDLDKRFVYHCKENSGLADTRNYGIKHSNGYFILPLDSDDKIGTTYIEKAVQYFEEHPDTKLVYCEAELFGTQNGVWHLAPYNYENLLRFNHIFCSCVYRRSDYDKTCGYNPNMKYGLEDWDYLLSLLNREDKVYRIPETLFYYRKKEDSMVTNISKRLSDMHVQVIFNHPDKYRWKIKEFVEYQDLEIDYRKLYEQTKSSYAYRIGKKILKPLSWIRSLKNK